MGGGLKLPSSSPSTAGLGQYVSKVLYEAKSNDFTHHGAVFLAMYFIAFDFILLPDLNSNLSNLIEVLPIRIFLVN